MSVCLPKDCLPKDFKSLEFVTEEIFGYVRGVGIDLCNLAAQVGGDIPTEDGVSYTTIGESHLLAKWQTVLAMLEHCREDLNRVMDVVGKPNFARGSETLERVASCLKSTSCKSR